MTRAVPLLLALALALPARAATVAAPSPPAVTVTQAAAGPIAETAVVTGTLVPREEVLVSPQIDGLAITEIDAEEGDRVAAGQVLARLSHDALDASIAQNTAQIAHADAAATQAASAITEAQAARVQADATFARTKDLVRTAAASRATYDTDQAAAQTAAAKLSSAIAQFKVAQSDQALARAQRQTLEVQLARTAITAPVAGVVSRRVARVGSVVSMSGEPLFRIIGAGRIELAADVPETVLSRMRPGQAAALSIDGQSAQGRIRLVSPEVDQVSRLGRVRVAIDPPAEGAAAPRLVIGGFGRAVVTIARHDGLLVPLSAVLFQPGGPVVQAVRDGVVQTRPVTLGLRAEGEAEILRGVVAGEKVIAISGSFVRDGDRVAPVSAPVAASAGG